MNPESLHILRHSLGLDDNGNGRVYRNHFATDASGPDGLICEQLCKEGMMWSNGTQEMFGGMHIYHVTDKGKKAVAESRPALPKLTASQKRYRKFLESDCGLSFGEWLKAQSLPELSL